MSITQTFYNNLATQYDKLFLDWQAATQKQAVILDRIFMNNGFDKSASVLDCACGIGTQAIGLAAIGYNVPWTMLCLWISRRILLLTFIKPQWGRESLSRSGRGKEIIIG